METRLHKDIVAFRSPSGQTAALHAHNLQVAELSDEAWNALGSGGSVNLQTGLNESRALLSTDGRQEIEEWQNTIAPETSSDEHVRYINSININVTQVCNLQCVYCEAGGDGSYGRPEKKIQLEQALPALTKLLNRVPNDGEFTVTFVGGEPLLYPEGIKIIADFCRNKTSSRGINLNFRLVTNGTLFTEATIQLLAENSISLVISLDGPEQLQNRIRPTLGGKASFEKVESGLSLIAKYKSQFPSVTLRAVFGKHNVDVEPVYAYFSQWDFDAYEFNFDVALSDSSLSQTYTDSLIRAAHKAFAAGGEPGLRKIRFFDRVFDRIDRRVRVENFCDSGKSFAVLDSQGSVFKCPWETNSAENSLGKGDLFNFEALQGIEMSLIEHNNCGACWARHLCGGGCMYAHGLATGAKTSPDRVYCKRTRSLISEAIMFYLNSRKDAL